MSRIPPMGSPFPTGAQWTPGWPGQWPSPQPPRRGGALKWVLGAMALLAVIGLTVAVTLAVTGRGGGSSGAEATAGGGDSDIASANDTGPVSIITEDPSCAASGPIFHMRAAVQGNGWGDRDPSIPASEWSAEVRQQYEEVASSMRESADQLVPIARITPHRVMRELYEQMIAYSRAYADRVETYRPEDNSLARVATTTADVISNICNAIDNGSALARAPLVSRIAPPKSVAPVNDGEHPRAFLSSPNQICAKWSSVWDEFNYDVRDWLDMDPDIPASEWSAEQKAIGDSVKPVMMRLADQVQVLGVRSGNPILQDFAELSAQYRRAYAYAIDTYMPADEYLALVSLRIGGIISEACVVAGA